jgi:multicomponent Na+:H+ antiporter subunit D
MCLAARFNRLDLRELSGAAKKMPWTMAAMVLGGLSLIGVPGTAGFISKWTLVSAAIDEGAPGIALIAVIVLGSLMAVVYIWRIVEAAYFSADGESAAAMSEAPLPMLIITWGVVLANVYFGLVSRLPMELSRSTAESLLRHLP